MVSGRQFEHTWGWTAVGAMSALSVERARRAPQMMVCSLTIWKIGKTEINYTLSSYSFYL